MTGHQDRPGVDWVWVADAIRVAVPAAPPLVGLSSLAIGADQVFAEVVVGLGGHLVAVIPQRGYERHLRGSGLRRYRELLLAADLVQLDGEDDEQAFLDAGIFVADNSELLIAVWDGLPPRGKGGTADVVAHAQSIGRPWVHVEPVGRTVVWHV